jgi:2-keto-4-pentenoate hydratase/2-oxohepta-3-ene-1,7-dioic acid hydratase in catechol pathway
MKWMRGRLDGRESWGRLEGDEVLVHEGDLAQGLRPTGERWPLERVQLLMPCQPRTMLGLWNNFQALAEKNNWARPDEPLYFLKAPGSWTGPDTAIPAPPPEVGRIAYEGELAVVIGRRAHRVTVEEAPAHIFGYTCANDVTAMELLHRDPSFAQWTRAKGFEGFGAFGPVIETEFHLEQAVLRTRVGGRERQNYPLADMIFKPAELVSRLSQDLVLEPGDVILCGTSLGVLPMKPGTEVEVEIDGIGVLRNRFG